MPRRRCESNSSPARGGEEALIHTDPSPHLTMPKGLYCDVATATCGSGDRNITLTIPTATAPDLRQGGRRGCTTSCMSRGGSNRRGSSGKKSAARRSSSEKKGLREEEDAVSGTSI